MHGSILAEYSINGEKARPIEGEPRPTCQKDGARSDLSSSSPGGNKDGKYLCVKELFYLVKGRAIRAVINMSKHAGNIPHFSHISWKPVGSL